MERRGWSKRFSIFQIFTKSEDFEHERQRDLESQKLGLQRLANAMSYGPPEIKPLKAVPTPRIVVAEKSTEFSSRFESTEQPDSRPVASEIRCSLLRGSWRCQCPQCLSADKTA